MVCAYCKYSLHTSVSYSRVHNNNNNKTNLSSISFSMNINEMQKEKNKNCLLKIQQKKCSIWLSSHTQHMKLTKAAKPTNIVVVSTKLSAKQKATLSTKNY